MTGAGAAVRVVGVHSRALLGAGEGPVDGNSYGGGGSVHPPDAWLLGRYRLRTGSTRPARSLLWFWERTEPLDRRRLLHLVAHAVAPYRGAELEWVEASIPARHCWRIAYGFWCRYMYEFDYGAAVNGWRVDGFESEAAVEAALEAPTADLRIGDVAALCDHVDPAWIQRRRALSMDEFPPVGLEVGDSGGAATVIDPPSATGVPTSAGWKLVLHELDGSAGDEV